jgi:probable F420-dependent oxidoreductase
MELGLFGINLNQCAVDPDLMVEVAVAAEASGWESVWTGEHYVLPEPRSAASPAPGDLPMLDPFVALALIASRTERLLLATGIIVVPLHQPLALAKRVASLDRASRGRFLLGVGVGYLEEEFRGLDAPFDHRGARTVESLAAMQAIWNNDAPTFDGEYLQFAGLRAEPRPVQLPTPPVHFGGYVASSFERAVRQGHGWYGYSLDVAQAEALIAQLREVEAANERPADLPPLEITITPHRKVALDSDAVAAYEALGVDRLVVLPTAEASADGEAMLKFVRTLPTAMGLDR